MKVFLTILLFIFGIFAVLAIGGGLLVLVAYGTGWLVNHLMGLDPFQATLIALLGICVFGILAERIWEGVTSMLPFRPDDDEYDDEYDDDEGEEDEDAIFVNPRIPRWRQPLKNVDFSNIKPDDRCPCGSGRKYKNCHGTKQSK